MTFGEFLSQVIQFLFQWFPRPVLAGGNESLVFFRTYFWLKEEDRSHCVDGPAIRGYIPLFTKVERVIISRCPANTECQIYTKDGRSFHVELALRYAIIDPTEATLVVFDEGETVPTIVASEFVLKSNQMDSTEFLQFIRTNLNDFRNEVSDELENEGIELTWLRCQQVADVTGSNAKLFGELARIGSLQGDS